MSLKSPSMYRVCNFNMECCNGCCEIARTSRFSFPPRFEGAINVFSVLGAVYNTCIIIRTHEMVKFCFNCIFHLKHCCKHTCHDHEKQKPETFDKNNLQKHKVKTKKKSYLTTDYSLEFE